ncbi:MULTISPECIES: helix-turn-helix transcriptional regulator [Salinibaculum]|uniref:helix-turn-helix transcriptional regulator n=1 Tax=Salinibaculum TaxID=2732368 RepID=UPI0030CF7331
MSSGSVATLIVVLLAVLGAVAGPGLAATADAHAPQQVSDATGGETSLVVALQADGDARWHVSTTFNLTTANETAAYRDLAESFRNNETAALGLPAFREASSLAGEATGRSMELTNVTRTAAPEGTVENGTGRLTLSFTWTNFGRVQPDGLVIGDVFRTPGGQWLPGLGPDQTLTIRPPEGFGVVNASVAPEDGTLQWDGPAAFGPSTLDATFTGSGPNGGTGTAPGTPPGEDPDEGDMLWVVLFLLGAGALAVVGYFVVQREDVDLPSPGDGASGVDAPPTEPPTAEATMTTGETGEEESTDDIDEELLSDEERVERLLEQNGGRMKQANIVKETGWSNAKVSQLLSAMQEEGRIDKLRIGRENLISFPDEDITDVEE